MGKSPFLERVRSQIRLRHYSIRTEQSYLHWIYRFILFHNKRHPAEMGSAEITAFLSHLATERNVASSTQNQALNAIVFLYRDVLDKELGDVRLNAMHGVAACPAMAMPLTHSARV